MENNSVLVRYIMDPDMTGQAWTRPATTADVHKQLMAFARCVGIDYWQTQRELCYELKRLRGSYVDEVKAAHDHRPSKWMPARQWRASLDMDD